MTTTEPTQPTAPSDAAAIISTATRATVPAPLDPGINRFYSVVVPAGGSLQVVDMEERLERFLEHPRRKQGTYAVHDADSFVVYLAKHALPQTEVWADAPRARLTAIINGHEGVTSGETYTFEAEAGWGDHRLDLVIKHTDAWNAWKQYDGKLLDQSTFAEHIENRAVDIVSPSGADMLELAQTFQATIGVSFESSKLLSSGQRQLEYKETVESRAGRRGQLEIPKEFVIGLTPFEGAPAYKVTARFRYRITEGQLRVGYRLDRPEDVLREAYNDVVNSVALRIESPVLRGTAP